MENTKVNTAVQTAINALASVGSADMMATAIIAFSAAKQNCKDDNSSIHEALLSLVVAGAGAVHIKAVAARIRAAVAGELRVAAGLTRIKLKGAVEPKKPGVPTDFSTPSAYALTIGELLEYQHRMGAMFLTVRDDIVTAALDAGKVIPVVHACGLFDAISPNKRLAEACAEYEERKLYAECPALAPKVVDTNIVATELAHAKLEIANLKAELATLQETMQAMRDAHAAKPAKPAKTTA